MSAQANEMMQVGGKTRMQGWDLDYDKYPHRTPEEWAKAIRRDQDGVSQVFDKPNLVMEVPVILVAKYFHGDQAAWETLKWHKQALGCGAASPINSQTDLVHELVRKGFTEHTRDSKINYALTIYASTDFQPLSTTISAVTSTSSITLTSTTGLSVGDLIRVQTPVSYEYKSILTLPGANVVTFSALNNLPVIGASVDQVVEEAGLFGNKPADLDTGTTATFTNGSAVVAGIGTTWLNNVVAGDKIRRANDTKWYTIKSVDSNTQITLGTPGGASTNFAEATSTGVAYYIRGTMFNRVTGIQYIKQPTRGFAFETQWAMT